MTIGKKLSKWLGEQRDGALLLAVSLLLMTGFACSLWFIQSARSDIAEQMAVEQARHYMEALTAFRTLYTKTVVAKAKAHGMKIRHDHADWPDAIPLPATLTNDLGKLIAADNSGVEVRLYSDYPFPWRLDGGPRDEFEARALARLREHPTELRTPTSGTLVVEPGTDEVDHRNHAERSRGQAGQTGRRSSERGQERLPRQHESRDSDTHERRNWLVGTHR